jgi:predicted SnoaL-like aldol condensation-catalyzing enzyme
MKFFFRIFLLALSVGLISCSGTAKFNQFYGQHKNDNNVKSFQVPRYLKSLVKNISPELNSVFKNVSDFKTISFTNSTPQQDKQITDGVNNITRNYTDVIRNNNSDKKTLVSVKEKGDFIKEVLIHTHENNNHKIIFLKGNFDPDRIKSLIDDHELEELNF